MEKIISAQVLNSNEMWAQHQALAEQALKSALQKYGPTVRIDGLLEITCVSRSAAYVLMKTDPDYPKGIPLYNGENSPKFYWTHEAIAWVESRSNKYRTQQRDI